MKKNLKILSLVFVLMCFMTSSVFAGTKSDFMYLYKTDWDRDNLNYKLLKIIEQSFSKNAKSEGISNLSFQLGFNKDNIIEKIQKDMFAEFNDEYEEFLQKFEHRLPENHIQIKNEAERDFIESVWPELKQKLSNPLRAINWFVLGFVIFAIRAFILKIFSPHSVRKARFFLGIAGLAILVIGAYNASQIAGLTKTVTRKYLYENTRDFYISQLPELYMEALN
ncbi:MAG: hypothetical protein IJP69_05985 [Synergistaceae bacterium]|nr:hypothetical protein [Synergistaceae bacterium]